MSDTDLSRRQVESILCSAQNVTQDVPNAVWDRFIDDVTHLCYATLKRLQAEEEADEALAHWLDQEEKR